MKLLKSLAVIACSLALTGCLIPEEFEAIVTINDDGSYTFEYDGTLAFGPVLPAHNRNLSASEEDMLRVVKSDLEEMPGFEKVEYEGAGRYDVEFAKEGKAGEFFQFIGDTRLVAISPKADGSVNIVGLKIDEKIVQRLREVGAIVDGKLIVHVPDDAQIIRHNAATTPGVLFGGYEWKIAGAGDAPVMVLKME